MGREVQGKRGGLRGEGSGQGGRWLTEGFQFIGKNRGFSERRSSAGSAFTVGEGFKESGHKDDALENGVAVLHEESARCLELGFDVFHLERGFVRCEDVRYAGGFILT